MKKRLRFLGSCLLSALRLALGALLFTPVFALLVAVNYGVDCQGYFLGDTYLREIATMLFEGKNVVGFNQLNGRELEVLEVIVANMNEETTPETIALGSSRILQLTREMVGTSFYNSGTSGGDFNDVLSVFSLYDKAGKLPKNVIIGLDPWLFNTDVDANGSNDPSLYAEFLTEKLGVPTEYEKKDLSKTWKNLFDLTYFQGNIEYMLKGSNKSGAAQTVDDSALYQQDTEVKCSDGSLVYDREFRGWKQDAVDHAALEVANNGMFRLDYYTEPDAQRLAIFEKWLQYMQEKGINVIILLSPYHPIIYDRALSDTERYGGLFGTEKAARALKAARASVSESFIVQRNGRLCIPVKKECRLRVPGSIVDKSSTGATVFIEPETVASLREELEILKIQEDSEERRILYELLEQIALNEEALTEDVRVIALLDFVFAKAKLSFDMKAAEPHINLSRYIPCWIKKRACPSTLRRDAVSAALSSPARTPAERPLRLRPSRS